MVVPERLNLAEWQAIVADDDMTLPDGVIKATNFQIWQAVIDEIRRREWPYRFERGGVEATLHTAEEIFGDPDGPLQVIKVWPDPGVQVNVFVLASQSIDLDFRLPEVSSQRALDALCDFVRGAGKAAGRDVVVTAEGCGREYMRYVFNEDEVRLVAK